MNVSRTTLLVTVSVIVVVGITVAPAAALRPRPPGSGSPVQCVDGVWHNTAVIEFSDVSEHDIEYNAMEYADDAIELCNLQGREQREVAGEIVAHVLGKDAPWILDPGPTIDIAGNGADPQEDKFAWLI